VTHTTALRVNHSGLIDYRKKSVKFELKKCHVKRFGSASWPFSSGYWGFEKKQRNEEFGVFSNLNLKTIIKEKI
jgi:hypothetical protein